MHHCCGCGCGLQSVSPQFYMDRFLEDASLVYNESEWTASALDVVHSEEKGKGKGNTSEM